MTLKTTQLVIGGSTIYSEICPVDNFQTIISWTFLYVLCKVNKISTSYHTMSEVVFFYAFVVGKFVFFCHIAIKNRINCFIHTKDIMFLHVV